MQSVCTYRKIVMNIFVLDEDPTVAAIDHCDKHCVKMVVELYQQLGSALRRHGAEDWQMPLTQSGSPLKGGYTNHPCTKWCGDSRANFQWAINHAVALSGEYRFRYGKTHACESGIMKMFNMSHLIPDGDITPFAQAMPDQYKCDNPIEAYRSYYWNDKRNTIDCSWKKGRGEPGWWKLMNM
jgi:hypothetical protein